MRVGVSFRILPGLRAGITFGGRRQPRIWASQRIARGVRITETTTAGRRRERTR